jgi:hypothetical protein
MGMSVDETNDGGFIAAGYDETGGAFRALLVRVDSLGNELWTEWYGGSSDDRAYSLQETQDGGYVVAGCTESYGAGGADVWLIRTDGAGSQLWSRTFGGPQDDGAFSVQETQDGGFIIAGYTQSYGAGGADVWLIRTDSSGAELWSQTYGGTGEDVGNSVRQTSDGGYVVAGNTTSYGAGGTDVYLIRTDADVGVAEEEHPREVCLHPHSAPNPFWDKTTIEYSLPADTYVRITVHDLLGRQIAVLVDECKPAGHHAVSWVGGDVESGLYFLRTGRHEPLKLVRLR